MNQIAAQTLEETVQAFTLEDGADLLLSPLALPDLTPAQAMEVVGFMKLTLARADSLLFRAGSPGSPFMVLVLHGDALVEGRLAANSDPVVLRTLTSGSLYGEMGASDSLSRLITIRSMSDIYLATLDYAELQQLTARNPQLGCALLRATLAHVVRRLRSADTWIETLNQINKSIREEWSAEIKSDHATIARLQMLMRVERKTGLRTFLVGDRIEVRAAAA
jgi:CRP/FNR family transcriptional regulator, cyclic AMP receptor protein